MSVIYIDEKNINKLIEGSDLPLLVDFYSNRCFPCKQIAPIIDELAEEYNGQVITCKADIDLMKSAAADFHIMSIPTLIIFIKGKEAQRLTGAVPKEIIKQMINTSIY